MNKIQVFTDGSVNTKTKIGYGAYLLISENFPPIDELNKQVKIKKFENTSSTRLELQILLWALEEIRTSNKEITVYTDSQNIISLLDRRAKLEQNNFCSSTGKLLKNHDLYQSFFKLTDSLNCRFLKVKGHQPGKYKDDIEKIFTLVDKASRKALRKSN